MILQRLMITASCFVVCVLFSCQESTNGEELSDTANDPASKALTDSATVTTDLNTPEPTGTDTFFNTAVEKISSLSELNKRLNKRATVFTIATNRDTVIKCKEGTLLSIPAGAFLNASNQSAVGEVKISVMEFYQLSDMMIAGLTTKSGNRLLETGGMINIKVTTKNNDSCVLKRGANITIAMANADTSSVDGMQLFNGVHDSTHIGWAPRAGIGGLAQAWSFRRNYVPQSWYSSSDKEFVFPEGIPKIKPALINSDPEHLKAEIKVPLRELLQQVGLVTRKANGYIDTLGNLQCYKIGNSNQQISFTELYDPAIIQDVKVNLAADIFLSYKSNLNHDYYQKLFKMGKGKPDSLITLTATLNPVVKITGVDKVKSVYKYAITLNEYKKKQRYRALARQEYENRVKQLRMDAENNATANLQGAQNYLLLSTPKLGWINCDRFYNYPEKVDYLVKLKDPASLLIVFNSIKSIISSDGSGVFANVPLNEKITLVGLKTENGQLMMALRETTITKQPFEQLSFEPITIKEYKSKLEKLNRL